MQEVYNPGVIDNYDADPPLIYRIMTPSYNGVETEFAAIKSKASGQVIPGVIPVVAKSWASNARLLGVRNDEVVPKNPGPGVRIQPGDGLSVIPTKAFYPRAWIPKREGGRGNDKDCWFALERKVIRDSNILRLRLDENVLPDTRASHCVIEPAVPMDPLDFMAALAATADQWICLNR